MIPLHKESSDYLTDALTYYDLSDHVDPTLIAHTVRLLTDFDMHPYFYRHPERSLFALAVAERWNHRSTYKEKYALESVLKLVSTGLDEKNRYTTYSGYVKKLSLNKAVSGTLYDPEAYLHSPYSAYHTDLKSYVLNNTNEVLSNQIEHELHSPASPLFASVRRRLTITKHTEKPVRIRIVNHTYAELTQHYVGFAAFYTTTLGEPTLVLGKDFTPGMLQHEYAHSQSTGMWRWYQLLLFRGITEAITESLIDDPSVYVKQRDVYNDIISTHPKLKKLFLGAYMGNEEARRNLFAMIIVHYGLSGFLSLARLAPVDNPLMTGKVGSYVFIKPQRMQLC